MLAGKDHVALPPARINRYRFISPCHQMRVVKIKGPSLEERSELSLRHLLSLVVRRNAIGGRDLTASGSAPSWCHSIQYTQVKYEPAGHFVTDSFPWFLGKRGEIEMQRGISPPAKLQCGSAACYCRKSSHHILEDLKHNLIPEDALVRKCSWRVICWVQASFLVVGANKQDHELWRNVCSKRDYIRRQIQ